MQCYVVAAAVNGWTAPPTVAEPAVAAGIELADDCIWHYVHFTISV